MQELRKAQERGRTQIDWLDSWHSFSFGNYHDRRRMSFGPLRVINDDIIAPGQGFGTHGHANMEIITVVLSGVLEHKDSLGTGSQIRPGDIQKMSAGTGIEHSEFNASETEACHLYQIWIIPEKKGVEPAYQQINLGEATKGKFALAASPDGTGGSISLYQDCRMYIGDFSAGEQVSRDLRKKPTWLHVASGSAEVNGIAMSAGDALAMNEEASLSISVTANDTKILLFAF